MWVFLLMVLLSLWPVAVSTARSDVKPCCQEKCGNVSVPYPFVILKPSCAMNDYFFLSCTSNDEGPYMLSYTRNIFTATGCDTKARVTSFESTYGAGCLSSCTEYVEMTDENPCSGEVNVDKIKMFPSKELDKATDHYNANRTLGQEGQGTVYKGMLADGKIVAVKKSKVIDEWTLRQFINEVVLLSQINHRNVVKLLGCCLETELPLLVYEFIPNGTFFQFLNDPNEEFPLTWEIRLRIATEVAGALFYLHSAASIAIFHRDIKSANILLGEKYRAKVADFGTSRSISVDQTHVTTLVQGTFGYLDPEYFQSSQFTDKSDVYSFGVVLVELLTGQKPLSFTRSEEQGRSLATYFLMAMESNCLFDILDPQVVKQGKEEDVLMVASLARSCLRLNEKERPTMKEVTMVLERIQKSENLIVQREIEYDRKEVMGAPWDATSTSTISSFGISASSSLDEKPLLYTY
ncbi:hypothetical protein DKX38_028719 [Salix brachista]|uniref:Protein kinase domain-containing protein n=1 Tax=Salix brachista TaxID=2182728 RepID=A0A5N5JBE5_9ROSI|nr:hypothetical protein DKX38_028719 [Salix brachista]